MTSASGGHFAFYFEVEPDFSIGHFCDFSLLACEKISVLFFDSENMVTLPTNWLFSIAINNVQLLSTIHKWCAKFSMSQKLYISVTLCMLCVSYYTVCSHIYFAPCFLYLKCQWKYGTFSAQYRDPANWRYVALVVVLWRPALSVSSSSLASVTALRWEPVNVHV